MFGAKMASFWINKRDSDPRDIPRTTCTVSKALQSVFPSVGSTSNNIPGTFPKHNSIPRDERDFFSLSSAKSHQEKSRADWWSPNYEVLALGGPSMA